MGTWRHQKAWGARLVRGCPSLCEQGQMRVWESPRSGRTQAGGTISLFWGRLWGEEGRLGVSSQRQSTWHWGGRKKNNKDSRSWRLDGWDEGGERGRRAGRERRRDGVRGKETHRKNRSERRGDGPGLRDTEHVQGGERPAEPETGTGPSGKQRTGGDGQGAQRWAQDWRSPPPSQGRGRSAMDPAAQPGP